MAIYQSGARKENAAGSAKQIYNNGLSAGDGLYWIKDPVNGKAFKVYCDMTTTDENGESGWMLVGSWNTSYDWTKASITTGITFADTPINTMSSNFADFTLNKFRVHAAPSISTVKSSANADWYYNWNTTTNWKSVWAPDGTKTNYYLSHGSSPGVYRCALKMFDYSYNMKFSYKNSEHKFCNIADFGYNGTDTGGGYTVTGQAVLGTASLNYVSGYAPYWSILSTPGSKFSVYDLSYQGNYSDGASPTADGTLSIPIQGSGYDTLGQDVDSNVSAKIGRDDDVLWRAGSTSAGTAVGSGDTGADTKLWLWIK